MTPLISETISKIHPLDASAMRDAAARWDAIAKPLHSLGLLEDAVIQAAGIQGSASVSFAKKALVVFCADNGVVAEGVTQTGQEVTAIVAENFLDAKTCTSIFAQDTGTDLYPIDIGMAVDTPRLAKCKTAYGTKNMAQEPAMTMRQAQQAVETGIRAAGRLKEQGYRIVAAGEMGIGNTATSSAVSAVLTGQPAAVMTGRGAGLSSEGLARKRFVIESAIAKHAPDPADPLDVLAKVGGFDLAGIAGLCLGAAAYRMPVVLDGFISQAAALAAVRLCPKAADYLFASHASKEPASAYLLNELGKKPFLSCEMCLGEGSGAVLLFHLLDSALHVYDRMRSFADIEVEAYVPLA